MGCTTEEYSIIVTVVIHGNALAGGRCIGGREIHGRGPYHHSPRASEGCVLPRRRFVPAEK